MLRRDSMNWTMVPSREIVCDARMPSDDSCPIRRFESAVVVGSRSRRAVRSASSLRLSKTCSVLPRTSLRRRRSSRTTRELQREHGDGRRCEAGVVPEEQRCDEQQRQQQRDGQYPACSESIRAIRPSPRAPQAARRRPQSRRVPPGLRADRGDRAAPQCSAVVRAPPRTEAGANNQLASTFSPMRVRAMESSSKRLPGPNRSRSAAYTWWGSSKRVPGLPCPLQRSSMRAMPAR